MQQCSPTPVNFYGKLVEFPFKGLQCPCNLFDINLVHRISMSPPLFSFLFPCFYHFLIHHFLNPSLQGFPHPPVLSWPGRRGGSHSRRRAACHPPVPLSTSRLYITEPGRPPPGRWSWWSSPSPPALDAPPAQPAHSGTWGGIKVNESENETSDADGQMGEWEDATKTKHKDNLNYIRSETNGDAKT